MQALRVLALVSTVLVTAPAYSAILTHQFSGAISDVPSGTSVQVDDTFSGAWALETDQPIQMITGVGFSARQYELQSLLLNLGGETVIAQGGVVFVSESTEASGETLDEETRRIEGLQLALRMREGIPADALDLDGLEDIVVVTDGRATLTRRGRLLANEVSLRLR